MKYELNETIATGKFKQVLVENYTKNFKLLCQSIKLNKVQQKILDSFITHGTIKNQYVGRVAGVKKEKKFFAAKKQYKGSIENRNEALMSALKVNTHQKKILDSYLKTGKVIGKYAGSIAGSTKSTKDYSAFRGFKEHVELLEGTWLLPKGPKAQKDLKALLKKPIPLGKDGDSATDAIDTFIGDDSLLDDLYAAGKKNPKADARSIIKKHMKRLGIKEGSEGITEAKSLKQLFSIFKRDVKAYNSGKELSQDATMAFMYYAMKNGEIKTDDPDEFDQWLDNNIPESVQAKEDANVQEKGKYTNIWNKVKDIKGVSNKEKDMISNMDPSRLGDVVKALAPMFEMKTGKKVKL